MGLTYQYCQSLRRRIENIEHEIQKRIGERHEDKLGLPWRASGDKEKPSKSRWGHEKLINELKAQKAALEAEYSVKCNDPEPTPTPCPSPVPAPAPTPAPSGIPRDMQVLPPPTPQQAAPVLYMMVIIAGIVYWITVG